MDNVTIRADRVGTYDGKNLEDSLTFSVFEEGIIDLNGEISSTYESETGKENNRITISDGEDNLFTMNVDNTVDELEKGKSFMELINGAEFTLANGQYSAVFSGEGYLRPLKGDIEPLEGETFDIFLPVKKSGMQLPWKWHLAYWPCSARSKSVRTGM